MTADETWRSVARRAAREIDAAVKRLRCAAWDGDEAAALSATTEIAMEVAAAMEAWRGEAATSEEGKP